MPSYLQKVDEVNDADLPKAYKENRRDMYILDLNSLILYYWRCCQPNSTSSSPSDRIDFMRMDIESDMQHLLEKPHARTSCKAIIKI